jgi:hypothetical protein
MTLDTAVKKLPALYCRVDDLEKSKIKYTVENYTELLTVTGQRVNTFAFVLNSQGTPWLPGSLGGSYYGKGLYIWTGDMWVSSNINLNAALSDISADKVDKVVGYSLTKNDLTDVLKTAYDSAVTWISTNGTNLIPNPVTSYRSDIIVPDIYSGYLLDSNPVIKKWNNGVETFAQSVTNLGSDWANRLTLTYI